MNILSLLAVLAASAAGSSGKMVFKRPMSRGALEHLGRVIGGTDAAGNNYPFAAFIMIDEGDSTAFCGGTVIARQWILTAGHCVVDTSGGNKLHAINGTEPPHVLAHKLHTKWPLTRSTARSFKTVHASDIVVGVGSVYNARTTPYKVKQVHVHPALNLDYFDNDIALLKLKKKLKFNDNVQPIRIDTDVVSDGLTVTGIGWGKTSLESQSTASVLQQVDLTTGDEGLCRRIRPEFDDNDGDYICVTTPDGRDTCSGDSGGPLLRRCASSPNTGGALGVGPWLQLGITSYGDSIATSEEAVCAADDGAGFYTHAAKYLDFITKTTGIKRESLSANCNGSKINFVGNANGAPAQAAPAASALGLLAMLAVLSI
ncbi:Transmembrane protease serine 12 [Coemansia sp. RSA 2711]|nr:Transmembrane protease serine 12 [Coemansia sp. RSA 2711]